MKRNSFILLLLPLLLTSCSFILKPNSSSHSESTTETSSSETSTSSSEVEETSSESHESSSESKETSSESSQSSSTEEIHEDSLLDFKSTPKEKEYEGQGYSTLHRDSTFRNGFGITKCTYGQNESPYHPGKLNLYPEYQYSSNIWRICQWSSKFDLFAPNGYELVKSDNGFTNKIIGKGKDGKPSKIIETNTKDGSFYLEVNASTEYDRPRKRNEPWTHLLLEQDCLDKYRKLVYIKDISSLIIDSTYTITKFENHMKPWEEKKDDHAAQLLWYLSIQNRNYSSAGYGQYIWFGIPLWDNRDANRSTNLYSKYDQATNTLIYSLPSRDYLSSNNGVIPGVNVKARANADIYPIVKNAFNEAKRQGYFKDTEYEDLAIGGMNFGYEIPGTYDIGAKIDDFGVYYK